MLCFIHIIMMIRIMVSLLLSVFLLLLMLVPFVFALRLV